MHRPKCLRVGACAGGSDEPPPTQLGAAIIFAPVGALVPQALRAVRKGGRVVCGGIHMSDIPAFPYAWLWEERQLVSVANLTRTDALAFEVVTAARVVVAPVRMQLLGPSTRPAKLATTAANSSNTTESWRLAPVTQNISGMPWRSAMMWRLLPSLPRSVGLGPVCGRLGAGHAGPIHAGEVDVNRVSTA